MNIVAFCVGNYTELPENDRLAVEQTLFPLIHRQAQRCDEHCRLDANSWGDTVIYVLLRIDDALQLALDVAAAWASDPGRLALRVVLHFAANLREHPDPIRDGDKADADVVRRRVHGKGIVDARDVALRIPLNGIWVTSRAAENIREALGTLAANMVVREPSMHLRSGTREFTVFPIMAPEASWAGANPYEDALPQLLSVLRSSSLRAALRALSELQSWLRNRVAAVPGSGELRRFNEALANIRSSLSTRRGIAEQVTVDVLTLDDDDMFVVAYAQSDAPASSLHRTGLRLDLDSRGPPGPHSGVAPYVVWHASERGKSGVAIVRDLTHPEFGEDIIYFERDTTGILQERLGKSIYKRLSTANESYRSLICAPIWSQSKAGDWGVRGALSMTSTSPNAFAVEDCDWVAAAAEIIGLAYSAYDAHDEVEDGEGDLETQRVPASEDVHIAAVKRTPVPEANPRPGAKALAWVHLTDLHFGAGGVAWRFDQRRVTEAIVRDCAKLKERHGVPDFVFVTGDIAFKAALDEYQLATKWLETLKKALSSDGKSPQVMLVPGNHDVSRGLIDQPLDSLHNTARANGLMLDEYLAKDAFRVELTRKLDAYCRFAKEHAPMLPVLDWTHDLPANEARGAIRVAGLCSVWVSNSNDGKTPQDHGGLLVPNLMVSRSQLAEAFDGADRNRLTLLLTHHPPTWLTQDSRADLHRYARTPTVHLCGHVHDASASGRRAFGGKDTSSFVFVAGASHDDPARAKWHGYSWGALQYDAAESRWQVGWAPRMFADDHNEFVWDSIHSGADTPSDGFIWDKISIDWAGPSG